MLQIICEPNVVNTNPFYYRRFLMVGNHSSGLDMIRKLAIRLAGIDFANNLAISSYKRIHWA